jgi:BirA family biotin operon repressor/biotin-[acetyl-CoA-carboxylase] ligase
MGNIKASSQTNVNGQLLAMLKANADRETPVRAVSRRLGLSSLQVERSVGQLRDLGFGIEQQGNCLKLAYAPDVLLSEEIVEQLDTSIIGRNVAVYREIGSTNDAAWEMAAQGAREGTVVIAEEQSQGRGRMGRKWVSPRGGLWMSAVLQPALAHNRTSVLTIAASVAVAEAIRRCTECTATIRWPNDILSGGKKLAGVLVETRSARHLEGTFILGIGVDVNCQAFPPELQPIATSLALETDTPVRRTDIAREVLRYFDDVYGQVMDGNLVSIEEKWKKMSSTIGRRITIVQNSRTYRGEVVDMDVAAGLMVRLDRGFVRAFRGEHVSVVKPDTA